MSSRFNRFLHIEKSRDGKKPSDGQVTLRDGSRFESAAPPEEPRASTPLVPEAHLDRFRPPEVRTTALPLNLDEPSTREQRFSRCIRCETENGRFTRHCTGCGADLKAPAQQVEDEKRWQMRESAEEKLREGMQDLRVARARRDPVAASSEESSSLVEPSLGMGLLSLLPHPAARMASLAGAVLLAVLLTRSSQRLLWALGIYLGVFIVASFVPSELWVRRRRGG